MCSFIPKSYNNVRFTHNCRLILFLFFTLVITLTHAGEQFDKILTFPVRPFPVRGPNARSRRPDNTKENERNYHYTLHYSYTIARNVSHTFFNDDYRAQRRVP